jgi:hypothetical protein
MAVDNARKTREVPVVEDATPQSIDDIIASIEAAAASRGAP